MGKMDANVDVVKGSVTQEGALLPDNKKFEDAARNDIEDNDVWYPIVKAGVTYRF